jgi:nucleoside-diphosphate-sugar epimerase
MQEASMQTILGAGGVIARGLAKSLPRWTDRIRLVSRSPIKVDPGAEAMAADLLDKEQTDRAVAGSEVVYLAVGLKYDIGTWRRQWPVLMRNVLDACIGHEARLVFFDNVYVYGRVNGWMTEATPIHPTSRKGEVRARLHAMIMDEVGKGRLKALIARAADFYGPETPLSFANAMVFENLRKGRKAMWMANDRVRHSLTYTPDAGRATAMLGNTDSAFGQVWHLPTDGNALTGREFIEKAAREFGVKPRYRVVSKGLLRLIGLFNGDIRESVEMLYQSEAPYLFDSRKFEAAFAFKPTPYDVGIRETAKSVR